MDNRNLYINNKQLYNSLKGQFGGNALINTPDTANVLIVVDVQNCFLEGGSLGAPNKEISLVNELSELVSMKDDRGNNVFDYFVVTRDMHPSHHASHLLTAKEKGKVTVKDANGNVVDKKELDAFLGIIGKSSEKITPIEGFYPPHCRVTKYTPYTSDISNCQTRNLEHDTWNIDEKFDVRKYKGNDVTFLYDNIDNPILNSFKDPDMVLSLANIAGNQNADPKDAKYALYVNRDLDSIVGSNKIPVLQVYKGQLCKWDAYSAFQYHTIFKGTSEEDVEGNLYRTTCLAEVLLSQNYGVAKFKRTVKKINIVVCGLVGDICVKHTIGYGVNLLRLAGSADNLVGYSRLSILDNHGMYNSQANPYYGITDVNFIYSLYATRFLPSKFLVENMASDIKKHAETEAGDYKLSNRWNIRYNASIFGTFKVNYSGNQEGFPVDSDGKMFTLASVRNALKRC
jgi:nicotinamidase-related amidase